MRYKSLILVLIQFFCSTYIFLSNGLTKGLPNGLIPENIYLLILLGAGTILGVWSMAEFRFKFNIFPELLKDSKLITSGPYRYVRHSIYTSVLMITLSYMINNPTYFTIILWIMLLCVLVIKLKYEEKLLKERFPDYVEYQSRTKMLIPFML